MVCRSDTWSFQGHPVHTVQAGPPSGAAEASGPAVLLVHGFGASTDHWRFNIPVLAERHEVHAIDLLGFGRSAKPQGLAYGGALWRDQLIAYVQERIGRPTVLVGNSLGGFASLAAGAALGETAAGVVLLNAAGPFSDELQQPVGWAAAARRNLIRGLLRNPLLQRLLFENLRRPASVRRTLNQVYIDRRNVDDELVEAILRPSRDPGAFGVFRTVFDIPRGEPLDGLLSGLASPLLLLWGIRDPWIDAERRRSRFQRHAPAATTEVVLEAGHCPHDEVPDQVNGALLEWLAGLPQPSIAASA
ncbi:alpha/beta fold hydrolase [Synechococcus sp. RSCCF101]|uniref:alpha/beta fold hydrolase n=1 Tax=Synechococcus sp. RSCCF101 TaxID=2511069 RepID=UPI00124618B2|nr:alpha/beta fold hydrolase [Synechococcus sp. RSCCF101]QEY33469.1 alpha/beta fold hydrolase [Synechococcus sp. RSCCF101]